MAKLTREDLLSLEQYHTQRPAFRERVLQHKVPRKVALGPHATLYFEDQLTIQYQIQEMLRVERIFQAEGISEELEAYNPLIPDGDNWKATFMIEYDNVEERRVALERLVGVEDKLWMKVGEHEPVYGIADEDLERSRESKTSAVHFVRFQLTAAMLQSVNEGAAIACGADHAHLAIDTGPLPPETRSSLIADLDLGA